MHPTLLQDYRHENWPTLVGHIGFEPMTSALSRQRSKPTELMTLKYQTDGKNNQKIGFRTLTNPKNWLPGVFGRIYIVHSNIEIRFGPMISHVILNVKQSKSPAYRISTMIHGTGFVKLLLIDG